MHSTADFGSPSGSFLPNDKFEFLFGIAWFYERIHSNMRIKCDVNIRNSRKFIIRIILTFHNLNRKAVWKAAKILRHFLGEIWFLLIQWMKIFNKISNENVSHSGVVLQTKIKIKFQFFSHKLSSECITFHNIAKWKKTINIHELYYWSTHLVHCLLGLFFFF